MPGSLKGEFVPAEQRLVVRLTPIVPAGATIQIQVRPAPNGAYYLPGEGPTEITGQINQARVQVSRDYFDEQQFDAHDILHCIAIAIEQAKDKFCSGIM